MTEGFQPVHQKCIKAQENMEQEEKRKRGGVGGVGTRNNNQNNHDCLLTHFWVYLRTKSHWTLVPALVRYEHIVALEEMCFKCPL